MNLANILSLLRAPLALLFLSDDVSLRLLAIVLAMLTDSIDGFLARRLGTSSHFGAILDPVMDKFFVLFAISALLFENKLEPWQACAVLSRDFFLIVFGLYLGLSGHWEAYRCQAIRWGKISTALQFIVLMAITLGFNFPSYTYGVFILFGTLAFVELCQIIPEKEKRSS